MRTLSGGALRTSPCESKQKSGNPRVWGKKGWFVNHRDAAMTRDITALQQN
jgi:hypothetical protein